MSHTIYLCNVTFSKRSSSTIEKELRNKSESYRNKIEKRKEGITQKFHDVHYNNYIGLIEYIPTNNKDIKESADILIYLYKNRSIISSAYKSCIQNIISFINDNNIKSIKLSGEDVERLNNNNIDIIKDIKNGTQHIVKDLIITVTENKRSSYGYHLI